MQQYKLSTVGSHDSIIVGIDKMEDPRHKRLVYLTPVEKNYRLLENERKYEAEGTLQPIPMNDSVLYVCGVRGSGKSYFVSQYANTYNKKTGNKVILVSVIDDDPSMILPERSAKFTPSEIAEGLSTVELTKKEL
jgi:predicted AAA+ superfamily ATPase